MSVPHRVVIVQGHPDGAHPHFGHALADAYAKGAAEAGHHVERIDVSKVDFPILRQRADWENPPPPAIRDVQEIIRRADHIVIFYPIWLGSMPALLKGFLEQVMRPGFAIGQNSDPSRWSRHLAGRSARVVVTMGMPALLYRWFFRAHSLRSLERNILKFAGIRPVHDTLIGMTERSEPRRLGRWLQRMEDLGRRAV